MSGKSLAIDTNVAIDVLNNTGDIASWVNSRSSVFLPVPVIGELLYGAEASKRIAENTARVHKLVARCTVLAADLATAAVYGRVRHQLKSAGSPIPENDVWIAALCLQYGLPLATADNHFGSVQGLLLITP